ncbi:MAG: DUF309 domain-containing protein [Solibacillus sp.]|uniref:DUF309 domain-containing protein n=1 Tax=unclassified Solibacillus TaxID=2637870 RepID=UPI0030F93018
MHPLFHPLFVDYCAYFNDNKDYFECHEVLEEYWKEIAPGEKFHPLVGYVQLATSMYHWRRENFAGASRTLQKAINNFEQNQFDIFFSFIDLPHLLNDMKKCHFNMIHHKPFSEILLPITNKELQLLVNEKITTLPSLSKQFIFNKHMLRDRSEILSAREQKKRSRD